MKNATAIRTTCPRDCYDACGIVVKISTDGAVNVVGDPEHNISRGALCGKCSIGYNGVWRDPSARLTRPLKRVGPKGMGRFEPTGWDQALDLFQTDTADYADYVLPAASFLEFDDVVMSYFNASISAQVKALPPFGEALPNQDIFRRLAAAMGLTDAELFETDADMITTLLDQAKPALAFETLAEAGTIEYPAKPVVQFEHHDYRTSSGKIELAGTVFSDAGLPRAPFASAEAQPVGGELRLLSPASKWLMNSSFGNDPKILRQLGEDEAFVHPDEAQSRGIAHGARVTIGNSTGAITLRLRVSADVPRGVILAHKSRWTANGAGNAGINVNALNPGKKADLAESCAVHSINVSVTPA